MCRPAHRCEPSRQTPRRVGHLLIAICQLENRCIEPLNDSALQLVRQEPLLVVAARVAAMREGSNVTERAKTLAAKNVLTPTFDLLSNRMLKALARRQRTSLATRDS